MAFRNISNNIYTINPQQQQKATTLSTQQTHRIAKNRKLQKCNTLQQNSIQPQPQPPQIRTSSPISSTTSDSFDAPPDLVFPYQIQTTANNTNGNRNREQRHASIKELAYQKLREQQNQHESHRSDQLPMTDIHTQPIQNTYTHAVQPQLRSNGKLKLLAYNNCGHLTVHIIKGKSYKAMQNPSDIDTYVRVDVMPDLARFYKQYQTPVLKRMGSKNRQAASSLSYDQKFSFEVNQSNSKDRICISVWSRPTQPFNSLLSSSNSSNSSTSLQSLTTSTNNNSDHLIGCFSFRIKSLMQTDQTTLAAYYHLLPESVGMFKHLRCHRVATNDHVAVTNVNRDLINKQKLKIKIKRLTDTQSSYGFTISGNCPCIIGKVDSKRQAFFAGLRSGDFISALDGRNVSRATCDSVVKMIKGLARAEFEIEVYRRVLDQPDINGPGNHASGKRATDLDLGLGGHMVENVYYEIPSSSSSNSSDSNCISNRMVELAPKCLGSKVGLYQFNLEMVPEEDEEDDDSCCYGGSDMVVDNLGGIRHVDSDLSFY